MGTSQSRAVEGMKRMYGEEIERYLEAHQPLKGAVFARDWLREAEETEDEGWRLECLKDVSKAMSWLRRAW